jgi:hypothetical protein
VVVVVDVVFVPDPVLVVVVPPVQVRTWTELVDVSAATAVYVVVSPVVVERTPALVSDRLHV